MTWSVRSLVANLATAGVAVGDDEHERLVKTTSTLATSLVVALTPIWIIVYLALGRTVAAAIPAAYAVMSVAALAYLVRTKRSRLLVVSQLVAGLSLPVLLQWSLGGFVLGSAVMLWSFTAPLQALIFFGPAAGMRWFAAFVVAAVISGLLEPVLRAGATSLPIGIQAAFFVLNVSAPLVTSMVALIHFTRQRDAAKARSESLLLNILPSSIVPRLKADGAQIADRYEAASVLFADIVEFTSFAERTPPEHVVELLSRVFSTLDDLAQRHGLEKIKTLGDGYLAVAGVPDPRPDHARMAAVMALEIGPSLSESLGSDWPDLAVRVGIASGPLIAGVIGRRRFSYDLWGDTVNTASRMASHAEAGTIQVTHGTARLLEGIGRLEARGEIEVKGKGRMTTYRLLGLTPLSVDPG